MASQFGGLNIPTLQKDQRIAEWEKLFRAAVAPLLAQEGGERLAISILPGYICRRIAEREIVEAINETESLGAFKILIDNLDEPVDSTTAMQSLRNKDWEPGTFVDDYFYELKAAVIDAKVPLRVACVILITQLPPPVQGPINDWLAEKVDITLSIAREFINKVRNALVEKSSLSIKAIVILNGFVS